MVFRHHIQHVSVYILLSKNIYTRTLIQKTHGKKMPYAEERSTQKNAIHRRTLHKSTSMHNTHTKHPNRTTLYTEECQAPYTEHQITEEYYVLSRSIFFIDSQHETLNESPQRESLVLAYLLLCLSAFCGWHRTHYTDE